MLENVTGLDVANEVIMSRIAFSGTILLVEGSQDFCCFERFVGEQKCKIIPTQGKPNAIEAVEHLEKLGFEGFLAIIDADFWHIDNVKIPSKNILLTDVHDLELMIINSRAFRAFIAEYASNSKIKTFLKRHSNGDLRSVLLDCCLPIGLLRWVSNRDNLGLKFDGLKYANCVNKDSLKVLLDNLTQNVLSLTKNKSLKTENIRTKLDENLNSGPYDLFQVCCGHDFTAILAIGLRKAIGSKESKIANQNNIEKILRLSYDSRDFERTSLYEDSKKWESANVPYEIFTF